MAVLRLKQNPVTRLVRPPWLIPNNTYWQNVTLTGDSAGDFLFPFLETEQGYQVTNRAIAAATLVDVTGTNVLEGARLESDLDANPDADIVFIMSAGVNDINRVFNGFATTTLADLQTGFQNIVSQIRARNMTPMISNCQIATQWTTAPANGVPQLAYDWNAWLNDYCMAEGIYVIPYETAFTTAGGDFTDGVHLTDEANRVATQYFQQGIKTHKPRSFP